MTTANFLGWGLGEWTVGVVLIALVVWALTRQKWRR